MIGEQKEAEKTFEKLASASLKVFRHRLEIQEQELKRSYEKRLISSKTYYARLTELKQLEIDREIANREKMIGLLKKLNATADAADRIKNDNRIKSLQIEITGLVAQRGEVTAKYAHAAAIAEEKYRQSVVKVGAELAKLSGAETAADRRAAIAAQFNELQEQARLTQDDAALISIDQLIDVKAAQVELDVFENKFRGVLQRLSANEELVNVRREAGLISNHEAWQQIVQLNGESLERARELIPEMERLASISGIDIGDKLATMNAELLKLKVSSEQALPEIENIKGSFQLSLTNVFVDPANKGLRYLASSFTQTLKRMAAEAAAAKLTQKLFGGGGGSGKKGGIIESLFGGFASGGYVRGPGTPTSDSIIARLSNGEYVIRADAVKHWGRNFFDSLNALTLPAFADGGLVADLPANNNTTNLSIFNLVDKNLLEDYLDSADGETTLVNVIERNRKKIKTVL